MTIEETLVEVDDLAEPRTVAQESLGDTPQRFTSLHCVGDNRGGIFKGLRGLLGGHGLSLCFIGPDQGGNGQGCCDHQQSCRRYERTNHGLRESKKRDARCTYATYRGSNLDQDGSCKEYPRRPGHRGDDTEQEGTVVGSRERTRDRVQGWERRGDRVGADRDQEDGKAHDDRDETSSGR